MSLLAEIEAFLAEQRMSATAFGLDALNDPGFVPGLRAGRDPKLSTAERVRAFMSRKVSVTPPDDAAATGNESELSGLARSDAA